MRLVIDTSALLAVLLGETERPNILKATVGAELIAPASISWEVGNALTALFKKRLIDLPKALKVLEGFGAVPIQRVEVDLSAAVSLAESLRIYAYDAYFLEVARSLGCPLLTVDGGLRTAAKAARVRLLEA